MQEGRNKIISTVNALYWGWPIARDSLTAVMRGIHEPERGVEQTRIGVAGGTRLLKYHR
jgi:hypothetical protein